MEKNRHLKEEIQRRNIAKVKDILKKQKEELLGQGKEKCKEIFLLTIAVLQVSRVSISFNT